MPHRDPPPDVGPAQDTVEVHARVRAVTQFGPLSAAAVRVWLFTAVLALLATLGYLVYVLPIVPAPTKLDLPWPILAVAFFAAETKVINVHFRRETHSFTLSEIPTVLGLFFLPPHLYLLAVLVGSGAALLTTTRQSLLKLAFNLANFAFITVVTLAIFHAVGQEAGQPGPAAWALTFAAMLAASVLGAVTIATVISLSGGAPQFQKLPEMVQFGAMVALANTSVALLAVSIIWVDPTAIWLLVVPLITLFIAYRAYLSEREKHERLELLYQSSRILQHSPELDSALIALLDHARDMFRAEVAEIVLYPRDEGSGALRTTSVHEGGNEVMVPLPVQPTDPVWARVGTERRAFFRGPSLGAAVGGRPIRQAMVGPLLGESGLIGSMTIANRLTEGTSFDDDDLRLLETLANQAAVALENGQLEQSLAELSRLKEQLRHQAYHDSLTGLANRAMFAEEVDDQLTRAADESRPVVLFLDLDDFKVVNDTLGHAAGDRLLIAVGERIRACIREDDLAARLGGDEFAILLADGPDLSRAMAVAQRIIDSLAVSFPIEGQDMQVGASIGIALARGRGQRADELLRNADVAMYTAKAAGKGRIAVFEPTMHAAIVARHELSAELSRSVGRGELAVYYQPIVDLAGGRIAGAEALVRWIHPTRGVVSPIDFISLAEENGTILALGRWVLLDACTQVARWIAEDHVPDDFVLSVNVSPVQVQQPSFIGDVEAILATSKLPPERLILELTETAMFQDTAATITKLEVLRARGVRIALDDFGTGYSSLGYLRRFPVDILKIARDFVVPADRDAEEWAFAHAIVALAQALGLQIIAEGIEAEAQADRLRGLGCEYGQGFFFSRPVVGPELEAMFGVRSPIVPMTRTGLRLARRREVPA